MYSKYRIAIAFLFSMMVHDNLYSQKIIVADSVHNKAGSQKSFMNPAKSLRLKMALQNNQSQITTLLKTPNLEAGERHRLFVKLIREQEVILKNELDTSDVNLYKSEIKNRMWEKSRFFREKADADRRNVLMRIYKKQDSIKKQ